MQNKLCPQGCNVEVPWNRIIGQIYLEWPISNTIPSTRQEKFKTHTCFLHLVNDKPLSQLLLARPSKVDTDITTILHDVVAHCQNFQHSLSALMKRLKTMFTNQNRILCLEIKYLSL